MVKSSLIGDVIIELTEIDSTNNYAMRLVNEGMADHGLVIRSDFQSQGKGQHGNIWMSEECKNLLISVVLDTTRFPIEHQFLLNAMTTVSIAELLMDEFGINDIAIKWPNDIYAGRKKLSGILIENHIRGNVWGNAVIGIGLNVNQSSFSDQLRATSILNETSKISKIKLVLKKFLSIYNNHYIKFMTEPQFFHDTYNELLLYRNGNISFTRNHELYQGLLRGVNKDGIIEIDVNGKLKKYKHKDIELLIS